MILNEVELKYRTTITQEEFEERVHSLTKGLPSFDLHLEYKDYYYYYEIAGMSNCFMRYREDMFKKTLTFKEELLGDNSVRKEVNIDRIFTENELETFTAILGFDKTFEISKEAVVIQVPMMNREFCWYEVNGADRFLEVELIGAEYLKEVSTDQEWLKVTDKLMKDTFSTAIKREKKSLFSLYKPKAKKNGQKFINVSYGREIV
jgi:adenylate cyclase class IV